MARKKRTTTSEPRALKNEKILELAMQLLGTTLGVKEETKHILDEPLFRKHSPEPWEPGSGTGAIRTTAPVKGNIICFSPGRVDKDHQKSEALWPANRDRIIACVNACAGIQNPEHIPTMVKAMKWAEWYFREETKSDLTKFIKFRAGLVKLIQDMGLQDNNPNN